MQKRILGYFDGLATAKTTFAPANTATANVHTAKTNKVQSASQTEKTSVSGFYKARKIAVVLMLLVFSVFCAIGSADWIISQQMKIEGGTTSPGETPSQSAFKLDESALQAHIEIAAGAPEATVPSKARANFPSDAASAAPSSYATTNATATPNAVNAPSNGTAPNVTYSAYNGTALTVNLKNQPQNAAKKLVDNDSTVQFTTKYITWDGTASLTPDDFTSANAATDGMPTNAGKYAIYVQLVGYTGENGARNLGYAIKYHEITKCPVAITWENTTFTYDGTAKQPTYTSSALCGSDKLDLTIKQGNTVVTEAKNAGTYTATLSASANYALSNNNTTEFTINKKNVTITWENTTFTYNGKAQIPTATATGLLNGDTLSVSGAQINAGDYTATATASENYAITNPTQQFTIKPYELIIEWSNTELTYNDKPQKPTATIKKPISVPMPEVIVSGSKTDANTTDDPNYEATARVDDTNYTIKSGEKTYFTIKQLDVTLNTLIQKDYDKTVNPNGIKFDSSLITFNNPLNNKIEPLANKITVDLSDATANNYISGTASETAGLFSYAYNQDIKAGSTYLISGVKFSNTRNFNITNNTAKIYLKYQTASVGGKYYTIEDALFQSGSIVLSGSTSENVITAFTSLTSVYSGEAYYTLKSGSSLLLPYNADNKEINDDPDIRSCGESNIIYSVLVIPQNVTFTVNGTFSVGGRLYTKNGIMGQGITTDHSVAFNNGNIVVNSGGRINSYGYLKGGNSGLITLNSGATALDVMRIYDWLGGTEGIQIHNTGIFPFKSYSIHNISCKTKIIKGSTYLAKVSINVQDTLFPSDPLTLVGESGAMFTIDSGYIYKSAANADSQSTSKELTSISGSNQKTGQKDLITLGENTTCHDNSITLKVTMSVPIFGEQSKNIITSKDYPLPISYINIVVPRTSTLNLSAVSYTFYPGSTLTVENGGTLNLKNSSFVFYSLDDCISNESWSKNRAPYVTSSNNNYAVDKANANLIINGGTVNVSSNASISGNIVTNADSSTLNLNSNATASLKVVTDLISNDAASTWDKGQIALGSIKADSTTHTYSTLGDIITGLNAHGENNFSTGTYYSKQMADGSFVWFKNTANITYVLNGGKINGSTANITEPQTLSANGYTLNKTPSMDYYEFAGWYDSRVGGTKVETIYSDCTVYAHWEAKEYTIKYNFPSSEYGNIPDEKLFGNETKVLTNPTDKEYQGETFIGWYLLSDYSGEAITSVSAGKANASGIINVYACYISADSTYTVTFDTNAPSDFNKDMVELESKQPKKHEVTQLSSLVDLLNTYNYNTDTDCNYYFVGWYLSTDVDQNILTEINEESDITLCAKWERKHVLTIKIESNDEILNNNSNFTDIIKYYKDETIDLESLYSEYGIAGKIDEAYPSHGSVKEYTRTEWKGTNSSTFTMSGDMTITAYHKRCYYITVTSTDNNITGGKGTFYVSPTEANYQLSVTCKVNTNYRYTANYTATNASVDTSGKVTFTTDSKNNITVTVTTTHWFKVTNSNKNVSISINNNSGTQDGEWYTAGTNIKVTLKPSYLAWSPNTASVSISGQTTSLSAKYSNDSQNFDVTSYITIT